MSSGLYVRNRVLWIRQFIYMLLGSTSSQVKMLCIKFFCSSFQLSRLKVKKTECGGFVPKWALFPYLEVGWHQNQKWQLYFISTGSALPSLPAVLVLPGRSSLHLRCSACLPYPGDNLGHMGITLPILKVLFTDRETESKSIDPSPQKSVADHREPQQI